MNDATATIGQADGGKANPGRPEPEDRLVVVARRCSPSAVLNVLATWDGRAVGNNHGLGSAAALLCGPIFIRDIC